MTTVQPIDDIISWSDEKLQSWQRDALRRLACGGGLSATDEDELLAMVKQKAEFTAETPPPAADPLTKAHFSGAVAGSALSLKAVKEVKNVNRLAIDASLHFAPSGLTVVYGRNGSGKSGFVRILRTACRTRVENASKLKVLANVYGDATAPQSAKIVVEHCGVEKTLDWEPAKTAAPELLQIAVFDTAAAALYVDQGHQIQFLPFGLAMPHKLNTLCLTLKARLEAEQAIVASKLSLAVVTFIPESVTKARQFYTSLTGKTSDAAIEAAATFSQTDAERLTDVTRRLAADAVSTADLSALADWISRCADECAQIGQSFSDQRLEALSALTDDARVKREAAGLDAKALFQNEPLPGVGSDVWRVLWTAARNYSTSEAYVAQVFPVTLTGEVAAACLLCQQPLSDSAANRLQRFEQYVCGALSTEAEDAELAVAEALKSLAIFSVLNGEDWAARLKQLVARDPQLGGKLATFKTAAHSRHDRAQQLLAGQVSTDAPPPLFDPTAELKALATILEGEVKARDEAGEGAIRAQLKTEQAELNDRKLLGTNLTQIKTRRDLLLENERFETALKAVATRPITDMANKLVDKHLSTQVIKRFNDERALLEIDHLQISLARKSSQIEAAFATKSGTEHTKNASDILSEGEQRALALSAFLTEVTMTEGDGPIVVDDPVSSLDRERCSKVAVRLATEAISRQVIVFTHDLVFFNDLCREAEAFGQSPKTHGLFATKSADAGKVDPAGVLWKGLSVKKRIGLLKSDTPAIKALHGVSAADYEFKVKGFYGRLRDTYERAVEECIFKDIVTRGADRIETLKLRYIHLSDALAVRFFDGMSKANTFSHDNPSTETVQVPLPAELDSDLVKLEALVADIEKECKETEQRRPTMIPKK